MARGVSASKEDVHKAIKNVSKGLFPKAFCKVVQDIAMDPEYCTCVHADGAGTMKRFHPRAQGRPFPIRKRTCNITLKMKERSD